MAKENKSRYALLGVLSVCPGSGYDIKKFMEQSTGYFWSESYGQIYPLLKQLEQEGLATHHTEKQEGKPERYVYALKNQLTIFSPDGKMPARARRSRCSIPSIRAIWSHKASRLICRPPTPTSLPTAPPAKHPVWDNWALALKLAPKLHFERPQWYDRHKPFSLTDLIEEGWLCCIFCVGRSCSNC